jgi:hypothetical protein
MLEWQAIYLHLIVMVDLMADELYTVCGICVGGEQMGVPDKIGSHAGHKCRAVPELLEDIKVVAYHLFRELLRAELHREHRAGLQHEVFLSPHGWYEIQA